MAQYLRTAAVVGALILAILSGGVAPARAQAPAPAAQAATLVVSGDVAQTLTITLADLKTMPRTMVTVGEGAQQTTYEGVLVGELLKRAGVPLGRDLSGGALTTYVRASGADGYQVVFSVAELDPAFTANDVIVADTGNGKPLLEAQGPFRLVAPRDKRAARGVRMLQALQVVRLVK
jgi:DMSO/TMAO reductase YedYZ molybdopterin-dependent catalytic subunit